MGSKTSPSDLGLREAPDGDEVPLGDLLSGRMGDLDIDSVEAVREIREDG